ncbi:hypothetical protein DENIS_1023 [Desulfonema ishimotonii]|uniref:Uncharacterized protein n=1 Tax=Desulfonema ishimotonii TaxID=45657 RepID=A0A401FSY0_9BACT|nr:C4-type zinc ribbon domain-containing protein [Desulfonema ishimotonii]GBC60079.1 hypothetical protein DENIS_1023 [Desulfonema ishimotonii]
MKEKLLVLIKLQKTETEIRKVKAALSVVARKADVFEKRSEAFADQVEDAAAALEDMRKKYRSLEAESGINQDGIAKHDVRLRTVKTNKEYQALLKEIDEIKKKNSQVETEWTELGEKIEEGETALDERKKEYVQVKAALKGELSEILAQAAEKEAELARLEADAVAISEAMPPDLAATLAQVRKFATAPVVVPLIKGGICDGCNMAVPPQLANELLRFEELKCCPFCNRILYREGMDSEI